MCIIYIQRYTYCLVHYNIYILHIIYVEYDLLIEVILYVCKFALRVLAVIEVIWNRL